MNIGEKILLLRERKGISRKEFAEKLGVSLATITRYEKGDRSPSIEQLQKIAAALDVKPGVFNDLLTLSPVNQFAGGVSDLSLIEPNKLSKILNSANNESAKERITNVLALYGHEVSPQEPNSINLLSTNGIKINLSDNDMRTLDDYMRFALNLKLEEILNTKEGE